MNQERFIEFRFEIRTILYCQNFQIDYEAGLFRMLHVTCKTVFYLVNNCN